MSPLLLTLALPASAATLLVPADHPNLQAAVNAAVAGDTIEVAAGTYQQTLSIAKDLTIVGTAGSGSTTWRNSGIDDVLTINSGTVTIEGFQFEPSFLGRAVDIEGGTVTLRDIVVTGNDVTDRPGGAFRVRPGASLTVEDSRLEGNTASGMDGGHIHADGATLVVRRTLMSSGEADEGGAIFATSTRVTLEDCEVIENTAGNGGALSMSASTFDAINTNFDGNSASGGWSDPNGGAGLFRDASIVTLEDVTATSNISDNRGGAFDVGDATVEVVRGSYIENRGGFGGAFYVDGGSLTMTAATFTENEATGGSGGAIRFRGGSGAVVSIGSFFSGNTATEDGGAIAMLPTGGGLPTLTLEASRFDANIATQNGGALDLIDVDGRLVGNQFCHNEATAGAGAFGTGALGVWTNNVFQSNLATGAGGALRLQDSASLDIINNTFVANRASDGAALSASNSTVRFINNAVAHHPEGGGVSTESTPGVLTYSLFWDNQPADLSPNLATIVGPDVRFETPGFTGWSDDNDCLNDELWPTLGSALVNNGDPTLLDPGGDPSDIGAYGGPEAEPLPGLDEDGDGFGTGVDCDDSDATVNPGATEDCTAVDRDCTGDPYDADIGDTYYLDSDGDGFGSAYTEATGCTPPDGYVANAEDCRDDDPEAFPGAAERCNGTDDDCDGEIDEDVATMWWLDADDDGFGAGVALDQCDPPAGYAPTDGDCDDTSPEVYPGADDEDGDGIDANCDGADGTATPASLDNEDIKASGGCGCSGTQIGIGMWPLLLAFGLSRRASRDR